MPSLFYVIFILLCALAVWICLFVWALDHVRNHVPWAHRPTRAQKRAWRKERRLDITFTNQRRR